MKRTKDSLCNNKKIRNSEETQELGIIESICLKNFMCHDHLKFDFDPHINFIIGQNGSGKSAILTGIILALGGKSSTTGRYANIKGFIKTGKQKAYISVVLKNQGDFAFKPDLYGEKVIVEREISAEGVSGYKLKSEQGRIISTQKEELINILAAMDIQIDNPVLVLTQETSRNFLLSNKTGKEERLYEFFYKGTGLQQIEDGYRYSDNMLEDAKREWASKHKALPDLEKDLLHWKNIVNSAEKIGDLKIEEMWAKAIYREKKAEEMETSVQKVQKAVNISKNEVEKCKVATKEKQDIYDKLLKEREECDGKIATCRNIIKELSVDIEKHAEDVRKSQGSVDLYGRLAKKLAEDITSVENSIIETQIKNQTDFEDLKRNRNEEIAKLELESYEASTRQDQLKIKSEELLNERNEKYNLVDIIKAERNSLEFRKRNLIGRIQQMKDAVKNRQVLFGKATPMVLEEIGRRRNEFKKLPKGPIGLDVEVKDPKWNNAIESCLKTSVLNSFCCDNAEDMGVLTQILKRYYDSKMPTIIVSQFLSQVHDVSRFRAKSRHPTVFDMLKIKDPVIANCLIDQLGIENIILIEDINTAQFMLDHPPENCKAAFLLNCDEILLNPYRHYAAARKITNSVLQTIDQTHISSLEQEYRSLVEKIQNNDSQLKSINENIYKYPNILQKIEEEIVKIASQKSRNAAKIYDLKQFEEVKDVSEMQDDLLAMKREHDEKTMQLREAEAVHNQNKNQYQETDTKSHEQKRILAKQKAYFDELGIKMTACAKARELLVNAKSKYETDGKKAEAQLKTLKEELKAYVAETEELIKTTSKTGPRIHTDRTQEEIRNQIEETEKVIKETSNCDRGDLLDKYKEKFQKVKQAQKDSNRIDHYIKTEERMLALRKKTFIQIIKHTQNCVDIAFTVGLRGNRCTGRIDFSKPGCLKLEVTPRQEGGKKDCSSLSGGERSYATIVFLLALWDRIKMPFRILDEYDVFMDSNNRNMSVNLLIKRAEFRRDVQFIFLSPLELPDMKDSDHIKVHKMPAPERVGLKELMDMET